MTDRLFDDGPGPFDMVDGVPLDLLDAPAQTLPEGAAYLRIGDNVLDDGAVARLLASHGAVGIASWFTLLVLAKKARAYGVVKAHAFRFGQQAGCSADEASAALETMSRVGLVWLKRDENDPMDFMVRVRNWHVWQSMTDAERAKLYRRRDASRNPERRHAKANAVTDSPSSSRQRHDTKTGDRNTEPVVAEPLRAHVSAPVREAPTDFEPVAAVADAPKWWTLAADQLAFIHQGDTAVRDDLAQRISTWRFHPSRRHDERHTPESFIRAAAALQRRADGGWRPQDGTPHGAIGFYFSTIDSHRVEMPALAPPTTTPETHTDDRPTAARPRHAGLAAFD